MNWLLKNLIDHQSLFMMASGCTVFSGVAAIVLGRALRLRNSLGASELSPGTVSVLDALSHAAAVAVSFLAGWSIVAWLGVFGLLD